MVSKEEACATGVAWMPAATMLNFFFAQGIALIPCILDHFGRNGLFACRHLWSRVRESTHTFLFVLPLHHKHTKMNDGVDQRENCATRQ